MLRKYSRFLDGLEKVERALLAISVAVMAVIIIYQVVLRYFFSASNAWSEESARYLMIFSAMVGSAIALRKNSHLQIDVFINYLKPKAKALLTIISTIAGIVFLVYLFRYSLDLMKLGEKNMSVGVGVPMSIPYAFLPLGIVLMLLSAIEVILLNVMAMRQPSTKEEQK